MIDMPLAAMLRPQTIEDIVGQDHILAKNKLLYRSIKADKLSNMIFYGPPGCGKTTIAQVIANSTFSHFTTINATTAGKEDMKAVVEEAKKFKEEFGKKTVLFIDEIHRFNKAQQDFLLPFTENGRIILIGATTENPYFEINGALLSRSQIFQLKPIDKEGMKQIIARAEKMIRTEENINFEITEEAKDFFVNVADGDARQILNAIELALKTTEEVGGKIIVDLETASECIQKKIKQYDKNGDNHYDSISAYIESMKHSEVDAALYYLARMLDRGEDPKYIARRLIVNASCDIGVACPEALTVAVNAFLAVERVGMPECVHALVESTIFNSLSPKSNTGASAFYKAMEDARNLSNIEIPNTLKDESYKSAYKLGHGGVSDVFASEFNYDGFECMPDALVGKEYYIPGNTGYEPKLKEYKDWCKQIKNKKAD